MTLLAIYLIGLACSILYAEWLRRDGGSTRGEQIFFSLGWPIAIGFAAAGLCIGMMIALSEDFDRRFGR